MGEGGRGSEGRGGEGRGGQTQYEYKLHNGPIYQLAHLHTTALRLPPVQVTEAKVMDNSARISQLAEP